MATNKNALIRYKTIDKCLQNRFKKWTLEELITACSDALYEYEGKHSTVSKRTVQLDIQNMRSDKLGYNAPIICYERKFYTYEDPDFSITKQPMSKMDVDILNESVMILSQFKDFSLFSEMNGLIQKLEDRVYRETKSKQAIIYMEKNDQLKGLNHLEIIYQAILKRIVLDIQYKSFKSRKKTVITLHPFILKEFSNRWFVVGRKEEGTLLNLALDRIENLEANLKVDYTTETFDADNFYRDTIGVTVLSDRDLITVVFKASPKHAPYIETKPLHPSQVVKEKHPDHSMTFEMQVHHNYELEKKLLAFGEGVSVLKPVRLVRSIKRRLSSALASYEPS
jgi:predicted DNA-binding transcriptional regulator YafY